MKKRLIEIEEPDKYFNECVRCGTKEETKKLTIGNLKWIKDLSRDELKEIYNNWRKKFMEIEMM